MKSKYRDYDQFRREVLRGRAGPMTSAAEDVADEIYQQDFTDEFDALWDEVGEEDEE